MNPRKYYLQVPAKATRLPLYVIPYTTSASEMAIAPAEHIPGHCALSQAHKPMADPMEVPMKLTVMNTVFRRLRAAGCRAYTLAWLDTCTDCCPRSSNMIPTTIPAT